MEISNINLLGRTRHNISWEKMKAKYGTSSEIVDGHTVYKFNNNYESDQLTEEPFYMSRIPYDSFIPWHFHEYVEITIVIHGKLEMHFLGENVTVNAGQVVLVDARCAHQNSILDASGSAMTIAIRPNALQQLLVEGMPTRGFLTNFLSNSIHRVDFSERYWQFHRVDTNIMSGILTSLIGVYSEKNGVSQDLQQTLLQAFLLLLMQQSQIRQTDNAHLNKYHVRPLDLIIYMDKHYQNISLETMALYFNYSSNYLSTKLKTTTGSNFQELIQKKRIDVAKEMLKKTDITVDKIAFNVGYSNPVYFYRLFNRVTGVTPTIYRKQHKS